MKKGLEYFPMDVDMFQDIRIRKLIKRQGGKAVSVYVLLLCIIYKDGYYMRWDEELPFIISEQTGFDEAYIREVVNCCMALGLFDAALFQGHKVLTSKGIQERYKMIRKTMKRVTVIDKFDVLSSEEVSKPSEESAKTSEENGKPSEDLIQTSEESGKSSEETGETSENFRTREKERNEKENISPTPPSFKEREERREEKERVLGAADAAALLDERKKAFYNSLVPFVDKYGREMVRDFFDYWTEPNKSHSKMRFELERTWDVSRRLGTWSRHDDRFGRYSKKTSNVNDLWK